MSLCLWYISKYVSLPSDRVGARSFLLMREMARLGHRTVIFTSDSNHLVDGPKLTGPHLIKTVDDVHVCWVRTLKYQGAKSFRRILSWLDFEWQLWRLPKGDFPPPDVVIASSLSLLSILNGLLLRRRYQCGLIFEVRDIWPLTLVEDGGFSPRNPVVAALAAIERLAYRSSDAIVGTMPNLKEHVSEVAGDNAAPVYCIPMGVDEDQLRTAAPLPQEYADAYFPDGKFIVGYTGTIGLTNALETLLECARRMVGDRKIHFLLVGEGPFKNNYRRQYGDLPNVSFAPAVPKSMIPSILARCDLLYFSLFPSKISRFGESLNKVIDYMLAAKPIVASYNGHPSIVEESGAGVRVAAGNAAALEAAILRYAAMSPDDLAARGAAGRHWLLSHRTYPRLARDYIALAESARLRSGRPAETNELTRRS